MSERKDVFGLGDVVCMRVDVDEDPGMVTCKHHYINGSLQYEVTWAGSTKSVHCAAELKLTEIKGKEL